MRVLHVISALDPIRGGTVTALIGLAEAQRAAGLEVGIVATFSVDDSPAATADALRGAGVEVTLVGPTRPPLHRHSQIVATLQNSIGSSVDVVHIHALWEEVQHQAARVSRKLGVPYVFTPHGMLDPWSLSQSRLKKRIYMALRLRGDLNRAAAIHFTTETERALVRPLGLRPSAITEPNGLSLAEFRELPPRGSFRAKHPILGDRPFVVLLSRLHYKKGLDLLIPAFARGAPPEAMLVLAGPEAPGYHTEMDRMVRENNVQDRVLFTGMLKGRDRIGPLVDADLFALPSYQENFGIAVIEAMAAGCPVIISDQVNIHREVAASGGGAVVPTKIEPLAEALSLWLRDDTLRTAAASKTRPFVQQHYDWLRIAERWRDHYSRLSQSSPIRAAS